MNLFERKTIFEIIKEAEEEEDDTTIDNDIDDDSDTENNNEQNESEESNDENDSDMNDDFDMDSRLEDEENEDGASSDDEGNEEELDNSSNDINDEEPVEANTDIFSSLSKEEQIVKIQELKKIFNDLFNSCIDLLEKINNISIDETNMIEINRITSIIYTLKQNIADYIIFIFPTKSYIENDISFNRFLSILNSITVTIEEIIKYRDQKMEK